MYNSFSRQRGIETRYQELCSQDLSSYYRHTARAAPQQYEASVQRLSLIYLVKEQSGCQNQEPEHPPIRDALSLLTSVMPWKTIVVELRGIEPRTS